jgi:dihydrofolate reductase
MNAVVAVYSDWGIGQSGTQTLVIPGDRRYFRKLTEGGVVIAGRKTFEDFRKPLPNRRNIILSRDPAFIVDGAVSARSAGEVLAEVANEDPDKVFVIGGGEIYKLFLPLCAFAYVTKIIASPPSDTFFPNLDTLRGWTHEVCEFGTRNSELGIDYSFNVYRNKTKV